MAEKTSGKALGSLKVSLYTKASTRPATSALFPLFGARASCIFRTKAVRKFSTVNPRVSKFSDGVGSSSTARFLRLLKAFLLSPAPLLRSPEAYPVEQVPRIGDGIVALCSERA